MVAARGARFYGGLPAAAIMNGPGHYATDDGHPLRKLGRQPDLSSVPSGYGLCDARGRSRFSLTGTQPPRGFVSGKCCATRPPWTRRSRRSWDHVMSLPSDELSASTDTGQFTMPATTETTA